MVRPRRLTRVESVSCRLGLVGLQLGQLFLCETGATALACFGGDFAYFLNRSFASRFDTLIFVLNFFLVP